IDTSIFIQRFFRGPSPVLKSRHIQGIYDLTTYIKSLNITPIFIFDGDARARGKEHELEKRRLGRAKVKEEYERACERAERIETMQNIAVTALDDYEFAGCEFSSNHWERSEAIAWLSNLACRTRSSSQKSTVDARLDALEHQTAKTMLFQLGDPTVEMSELSEYSSRALALLVCQNNERLDALKRRAEPLTAERIDECRRLVRALGYATHTAEAGVESESICAGLTASGIADAACTEDLDVLAFGGRRLVRGFYAPTGDVLVIDMQKAIEGLGLADHRQFVDLCILCGTDFSSTLERVGPVTALKLVRQFGSIERILETGRFVEREGFRYRLARDVFLNKVGLPFSGKSQVEVRKEDAGELDRLKELFGVGLMMDQTGGSDPFAAGAVGF
ncbi:hypothetical protein FBU59_004853, partial [Linderina macrospora]